MSYHAAMKRILGFTRFIAVLGVISSLVLSLLMFVSVMARTVRLVRETFLDLGTEKMGKILLVASIEQADVLLVATALMVIAFGLYALFVGKIDSIPDWLEIKTFTDLKDKLVNVAVVALVVAFFSLVIENQHKWSVLEIGGGIGIVILAVAAYGYVNHTPVTEEQKKNT